MSNQLQEKAASLAQILAKNRLTKSAEQDIEHKTLLDQTSLGKEQTQDLHENVEGVLADTAAAKNTTSETVEELPGVQPLNKEPEAALASTGTEVDTMKEDGTATGTPADVIKTASAYRRQLAGLIAKINKTASEQQPQQQVTTGVEVLQKLASLTPTSTQEDLASANELLMKLASTNPVFNACRDRILMSKMAEDINALAEAEGISPEQAAEELQAAADANPEMVEDLEDEATGEAVADLADAEAATDEFMGGVEQMAANASEALGTEVTPDDIVDAAEQTVQLAEELGVEPEVLIQQAMEELQGGGEEVEVTPEDEANAQAILDEAAANGISPEEVIQMAAGELEGAPEGAPEGEPAAEEAAEPAEPEKAEEAEEKVEKAASLQKRAGTLRAAFVQELRHRR